jgi:hypothetical protein
MPVSGLPALVLVAAVAVAGCDFGAAGENSDAVTPTPPLTPTSVPRLTVSQLRNAEYFRGAQAIRLVDGKHTTPSPFPTEPNTYVLREDRIAFADIDGDGAEDVAAFVDFNPWGTGYFPNLVVVLNRRGQPDFAASVSLEDRQRVESIRVEGARIVLDLKVHGPGEGRCCPTVPRTAAYRLAGGALVQD